jgi:hypothetical protein
VTTLTRSTTDFDAVHTLIATAPVGELHLTLEHRATLAARLQSIPTTDHRRLDAWMVEHSGAEPGSFRWSPTTARRVLASASLRRARLDNHQLSQAVEDEVTDYLLRAAAGQCTPGSLGHWLAGLSLSELALVRNDARNWATTLDEVASSLGGEWRLCASDAYYAVAGARTTLRGRRDLVLETDTQRIVVRVRPGTPPKSAGAGLRCDLLVDALAHPEGRVASRFLGIWPESGVTLAVDAAMPDVRAGGRDLLRAAITLHRNQVEHALERDAANS